MQNQINQIISFLKGKQLRYFFRISFKQAITLITIQLTLLLVFSLLFTFTSLLLFVNLFYISTGIFFTVLIFQALLFPFLKLKNLKNIAQQIESEKPDIHNYLVSAYEISKDKHYKDSDLTTLVYQKAINSLKLYKDTLKPKIKILNLTLLILSSLLLVLSFQYLTPSIVNWLGYPFSKNGIAFKISASTYSIPKNSSVTLNCRINNSVNNSLTLITTDLKNSQLQNETAIPLDSLNSCSYTLDSIQKSFIFEFKEGPLFSKRETVNVVPPPELYSLNVELRSPYYTKKGTSTLNEGNGDITACYGTKATFKVEASSYLSSCLLIKGKKDTLTFEIENGIATGEKRLYSGGSYTFILKDTLNQTSDSTPSYFINIIPDGPPTVSITKPGRNKTLTESQKDTLTIEAYDDYGISSVKLGYRKTSLNDPEVYFTKLETKNTNKNSLSINYPWNISKLTLYPGDSLYYWVEIADNKPFGKPNSAISDTFTFRLPTYSEIHKMIANKEKGAQTALESAKDMQKNIEKSIESLQATSGEKQELSWEDKQIMKDLKNSLKEQSDSLSSAIDAMKEAVEKLKESGTSEKITDKMEEVQKELQKLLEELGDSTLFNFKDMKAPPSIKDMKEALQKMTESLPDLEKRLDNTIKYLKMLQKESERAMLADRAQKLAEEQFRMSEDMQGEELKNRETDLQKRIDDLLKDAHKSLDDENSPVKSEDLNSMKDVQKSSDKINSEMSKGAPPSQSSMNEMSASLSSMSSELNSTLSSTMAQAAQQDKENLVKMAQSTLRMTEWQKDISEKLKNDQATSQASATSQQALKDALKNSAGDLNELSMVPPMILADLFSSMQKAESDMSKSLSSISSPSAQHFMSGAQGSLNELANKLLSAANGMSQQGGGSGGGSGGLQQALQQMSGQQAAINSATSQLLQSMLQGSQPGQQPGMGQQQPGGQNGSGEKQGLQGSAKESVQKAQKALADKLKELSEKYSDAQNSNLKSRVEELEKEAQRITRLFNNPNAEISQKQDLLLKRMLEATMSLNRKDEGKEERKSRTADKTFSKNRSEEPSFNNMGTDDFYKIRSKALSGDYPISYREKISKYFDRLQKQLFKDE